MIIIENVIITSIESDIKSCIVLVTINNLVRKEKYNLKHNLIIPSNKMNVIEDMMSFRRFGSAPLIPYLIKVGKNYEYGYLFVSFGEDRKDCVVIDEIHNAVIRKSEDLFIEFKINEVVEPLIIPFEEEKMVTYQEKFEEYTQLIDEGKFDDAIKLFNKITTREMVKLFSSIFNSNCNIERLCSEETILIETFGKLRKVDVVTCGDSRFDNNGNYEKDEINFNDKELKLLNWLLNNVSLEDYCKEIAEYINEKYEDIGGNLIKEEDVCKEIAIKAIIIKVTKEDRESPEIGFVGDCKCDDEHGICIGFKNGKFLGVSSEDWMI